MKRPFRADNKLNHLTILVSSLVLLITVTGRTATISDPVETFVEAVHDGDLHAVAETSKALPSSIDEEERVAIIQAIDRLSPGAELLPVLKTLADKYGPDGTLTFLVARAYWRAGNIEFALEWSQKAIDQEPENTRLLYQAAALAQTLDRLNEAERRVRMLLEKEPNHIDGLFLLGRILASRGDDTKARKTLLTVVQANPDHYLAQYELGRLEIRARNSEQAEQHLRAAVQAYPFFEEAYNMLLMALARQKKMDEVKETRKIVVHLNSWSAAKKNRLRFAFLQPSSLNTRDGYELALELCHIGREDLAKRLVTKVLEEGRASDPQKLLLANLRYQEQDFRGCLELIESIKNPQVQEMEAYASLNACALFFIGRVEECREYYKQIPNEYKESQGLKTLGEALEEGLPPTKVESATKETTKAAHKKP